jgi:hypothetical protein
MPFIITSDTSKQYLREDDAVKGFEIAVGNGQSRMALTILVDVINGIMDIFNALEDELELEEEESAPTPVAVEEPKLQKQVQVAEAAEEEVLPVAKPVAKKETKTTEEK